MMRNIGRVVLSLTGLVVLAGCIESRTVVNVEKDGSGTVEQTIYLKAGDMPGQKMPSEGEQLAAIRAQAVETAKSMGEGVELKDVEKLPPRDEWKGYRITFAFTDVRKLRVSPAPEFGAGGTGTGPAGGGPGVSMSSQDDSEPIRFDFTAEPTPKLTLNMPPMKPPRQPQSSPDAQQNPQAEAMAKMMMAQLFDGMRVEFHVRVDGKISETNAKYVSKSREVVGLLRADLGGLVQDSAALDKMSSMQPQAATPDELRRQLEDPQIGKYLQIETAEQVEIAFE